jgi:hypothetical protein
MESPTSDVRPLERTSASASLPHSRRWAFWVAVRFFARYVRAPWWSALWLAPLALGWTYFWGLAPNLYGIALFLPTVVTIDRFVRGPTRRGAAAVTLVFGSHPVPVS